MESEHKPSFVERLKTLFIGGKRNVEDTTVFHKLTLIAFFAWVGLGADGLSSSCYGPEETFLALGEHLSLSIFVAIMSGITVLTIAASYSQIIELFPTGGGGYLVASKLLSPTIGMVSGSALLIDYVLDDHDFSRERSRCAVQLPASALAVLQACVRDRRRSVAYRYEYARGKGSGPPPGAYFCHLRCYACVYYPENGSWTQMNADNRRSNKRIFREKNSPAG